MIWFYIGFISYIIGVLVLAWSICFVAEIIRKFLVKKVLGQKSEES